MPTTSRDPRSKPFFTGGNYVNFRTADEPEDRTRDADRSHFDRLQAAKARYDPHNVFRINRNIRAGSAYRA